MGKNSRIKSAIMAVFLLAPAAASAAPLFDDGTVGQGLETLPFWQRVVADMHISLASAVMLSIEAATPMAMTANMMPDSGYSPHACTDERHCVPQSWTNFLSGLRGQAPRAQLRAVNRWANAKPYVEDIANWGLPDYWETPGEFIAHGGDCEDFAIAKYFSLVRLGFPSRDLRIVIVSDSRAHDFHAVLVARIADTAWLLDNQLGDIVPFTAMPQYTPIYSLNEDGWWLHSQPVIHLAAGMTIAAAPMPATPSVRLAAAN